MLVKDFDDYIHALLPFNDAEKADTALNGLQVSPPHPEIYKVAFAVDASLETFRRAKEKGADLLFVHHGLFFGSPKPITGLFYERIRFLIENQLGLYAVHLPLDMVPTLGNNAQLASLFQLTDLEPFGNYHGLKIGYRGRLNFTYALQELVQHLQATLGPCDNYFAFGRERIETVAVVSGGAPEMAREAISLGLDLFVTGENSHTIYHECLEAGLNVIFLGHYLSETLGPKALCQKCAEDTGLATFFIDVPTGL